MSTPFNRRTLAKYIVGGLAFTATQSRWAAWAATPTSSLSPVFSKKEWQTLGLLIDEILPKTASSPSATETGVLVFLDRMMMGKLPRWIIKKANAKLPPAKSSLVPYYKKALARLDLVAKSLHSKFFADINAEQRAALIKDFAMSSKIQVGYKIVGNPSVKDATDSELFAMIRTNAIQGYFADPIYGGNQDFKGWEAIKHTCQFNYLKTDSTCPPHEM